MKTILIILFVTGIFSIAAFSNPQSPQYYSLPGCNVAAPSDTIQVADSTVIEYQKLLQILQKQYEQNQINGYKIQGAIETIEMLIENRMKSFGSAQDGK